jgi:hypothetical protein
MSALLSERLFRQALVWIAVAGLLFGLLAWTLGRSDVANWCWAGGTVPVVIGLLVSMVRDFLAGRLGVDAVAFVSMSGALALARTWPASSWPSCMPGATSWRILPLRGPNVT